MTMGRWRVLSTAIIAAICLNAGIANAAPPDEADALVEQGVKLRVQGKNSEALELFKKAHALSPSARTLAQVGLAEGALHQWVDAEDHLVAALAAHDTPWIESPRNREALERALVAIRTHLGRVIITGPAGADVTVNGKSVGRLPLRDAVRVAEGNAQIAATPSGRRRVERRIEVIGGAALSVTLELPVIAPPSATLPPPASGTLLHAEPHLRSPGKTWAGGSLLAVSAAALATGIAWVVIDGDPTCSAPSGTVCRHLYDTKTQGWIAVAAGVGAGIGGGLLLWQGRPREPSVAIGLGTFTLSRAF